MESVLHLHQHCTCRPCLHAVQWRVPRLEWPVIQTLGITLLLLVNAVLPKETEPFTIMPYDVHTFRDAHFSRNFRYFHLDASSNSLYVGALEYVYKLDLDNIREFVRSDKLEARQVDIDNCLLREGMDSDFYCRNHIRSISLEDEKITVCGTGAYSPREFYLNHDSLELVGSGPTKSGIGQCPYDPSDETTSIYVRSGNPKGVAAIYSATVTDVMKNDPVIVRPARYIDRTKVLDLLKTVQDRKWLNDPSFVGSFDVGHHVYFFFRETAVEYSNCGHKTFSRVARVCKNDQGGTNPLGKKWTSFYKARLACSVGEGSEVYTFDAIRDVRQVGESTFIGVFTTGPNGLYGSAVCSFTLSAIESVFAGTWKEQANSTTIWREVPDSQIPSTRPGQCDGDSRDLRFNVCQWILTHPIMAETVSPQYDRALFYRGDVMYERLAVDVVSAADGSYNVFFLATEKGDIHKVVQWMDGEKVKTRLLTQWNLVKDPIWQVNIHNGYLYVGMDHMIAQYPVQQCNQYKSCTRCVQDPYCGWHRWNDECVSYNDQRIKSDVIQDVKADSPNYRCNTNCRWQDQMNIINVRVPGDPVRLHCMSKCDATVPIQWTRGVQLQQSIWDEMTLVTVDNHKHFLASDNSLIVFNVTESARFTCRSGGIIFMEHQVNVPKCDDPKKDTLECLWELEFRNWCTAFDNYKKEFSEWMCLKNKCLGDDTCMPNKVTGQCIAP